MDVNILERHFERIGARARIRWLDERRASGPVALDIARDRMGELFDIQVSRSVAPTVEILNTEPRQRHLLLMSRSGVDEKHKFLCGHDERHWFVAAVPEKSGASTVRTAMEALKPKVIQDRQGQLEVRSKDRNRRRNDAFIRQGEWFFVPVPELSVVPQLVLTNEPLRRGRGKPHMVEYLYRTGGELVYVSWREPNGLTQKAYNGLLTRQPEARHWRWQTMRRNPLVYVKGRVRHADHATIDLPFWHQVLMNTETQAVAMRHVAFLD